jgi:DNA-binding protein HU-beta
MTKDEILDVIVKKTGITKKDAGEALSTILEEITKALSKGGEVVFTGFGSFKVSKRAAREGRNPKTGEKLKIPAMNTPKFKAGKALKEAVK